MNHNGMLEPGCAGVSDGCCRTVTFVLSQAVHEADLCCWSNARRGVSEPGVRTQRALQRDRRRDLAGCAQGERTQRLTRAC